jgi:hypothetical protein
MGDRWIDGSLIKQQHTWIVEQVTSICNLILSFVARCKNRHTPYTDLDFKLPMDGWKCYTGFYTNYTGMYYTNAPNHLVEHELRQHDGCLLVIWIELQQRHALQEDAAGRQECISHTCLKGKI